MDGEIFKIIASQGVFAMLFCYLLFYVLKENGKREEKYQDIISDLTKKFNLLDNVNKKIDKIEKKIFK